MERLKAIRHAVDPWAGAIAGPLIWWLHQRSIADSQAYDCRVMGGVGGRLLWSLLLLAILAGAAWLSLQVWRRWGHPGATTDNRRFIALVSLGIAGLMGLAVVFQTLGAVIVPDCYR
ncbi:MAG TPA: hypothetical protein VD906_03765 [Caulobacteraceae bacterium]|nr:hypothetical protein [Caulobacteraceae bacterium]